MKKKLVPIIIAAVALAALGGLLAYLNYLDTTTPEDGQDDIAALDSGNDIYILGDEDGLTISQLVIENEYGAYSIEVEQTEDGTVSSIDGMEDLPVINSELMAIVNNLSSMKAKSLVAEGDVDFAIYGLDNPRAKVRITAQEGKSTLLVGNDAPSSSGVYVTTEGSGNVYLLTTFTAQRYLWNKLNLLDLTLTGGAPENGMFASAKLGGTVRAETIVIEQAKEGEAQNMLTSHFITAPVRGEADLTNTSEIVLSAFGLTAFSAVAIHPDEAELQSLGLAEPYSTIEVLAEEEFISLAASAPDSENMVNIITSGQEDIVYSIEAGKLGWLETQVFDLQSKLVVTPFIDNVARITVSAEGKQHVFVLEGEGDELAVTLDGQEVGTANFRKYYQTLIAAARREYVGQEIGEEDNPILEFVYHYREGGSDTVSFYEGGARRILISLNGAPADQVESIYMDRVLEDINKLKNGEDIKAYL